jgi:hypothetical protein
MDIWIVAVRKQNVTRYTVIHINRDFQDRFQNTTENWVEKLNAILFFRAANTLFMSHDIIQIDKDFLGIHARYVKRYMESLFGKFNFGTDKNKPTIQFIPDTLSEDVKEAHKYTKLARYRRIPSIDNPNIEKEFSYLRRRRLV